MEKVVLIFVEVNRRAARLRYHRFLERMGGLADKIHISCCSAGMRRFTAHHACLPILTMHTSRICSLLTKDTKKRGCRFIDRAAAVVWKT